MLLTDRRIAKQHHILGSAKLSGKFRAPSVSQASLQRRLEQRRVRIVSQESLQTLTLLRHVQSAVQVHSRRIPVHPSAIRVLSGFVHTSMVSPNVRSVLRDYLLHNVLPVALYAMLGSSAKQQHPCASTATWESLRITMALLVALPGTVSTIRAASLCLPCSADRHASLFGGYICQLCPLGSFSEPSSRLCSVCPLGTFSTQKECLTCPSSPEAVRRNVSI